MSFSLYNGSEYSILAKFDYNSAAKLQIQMLKAEINIC